MHEGTDKAKETKFQKLTTSFQTLRMKETETFDDCNVELSDIVNFSFYLREKIPKVKRLRKFSGLHPIISCESGGN